MALGLKVTIVEKLSNLAHFDYFSSKIWFFNMMGLNFRKDTSKSQVSRIFKTTPTCFESNLPPKKEGVNLHKSYSWTKEIIFRGQHTPNHNEIFFSAIKQDRYIVPNGLKPVNDKS